MKKFSIQLKKYLKSVFGDTQGKIFLLLLVFAVVSRFYNIGPYITFLQDEGRDALVMYQIVTLQNFPGIGPISSVGAVFLGPFYYYLMAPWLLIFNFNPVGPAVGVAVYSIILTILSYSAVKDLTHKNIALLFSAFMIFSQFMIKYARFSWNPNLLPYFSILSVYLFIKALETRKRSYFAALGLMLGFTIQLHYVALSLLFPIGLISVRYLYDSRKNLKEQLIQAGIAFVTYSLAMAPLTLFDIRNNFLNSKNFIKLFVDDEFKGESLGVVRTVSKTFHAISQASVYPSITSEVSTLLFIGIILAFVYCIFKKHPFSKILTFLVATTVLTAFFTSKKNPHYFGHIYPLLYLVLAYYIVTPVQKHVKKAFVLGVLIVVLFIFGQAPGYPFFFGEPNRQIDIAEDASRIIYDNVNVDQYQLTSIPGFAGDSRFRYFLEVWGKPPMPKEDPSVGDELVVVCDDDCTPIGNPEWEIASFAPTKVTDTWKVRSVTIYKLIR